MNKAAQALGRLARGVPKKFGAGQRLALCAVLIGPRSVAKLEAKTDRKKPVMSSPRRHSQGN